MIRNARRIQSASDGCRPPGRSAFPVPDEWCARLDSNQRSACYEQVALAARAVPALAFFAVAFPDGKPVSTPASAGAGIFLEMLRATSAMIGQGGRLRSCDLSVPSRGLYQTELHPVELALRTGIKPASTRRQRVRLVRCVTEQTRVGRQCWLVDLAGIEPALTRIKNPPLNRSATGLRLVNPGGLEPPAVGLKVPCPADPGFVRSGS